MDRGNSSIQLPEPQKPLKSCKTPTLLFPNHLENSSLFHNRKLPKSCKTLINATVWRAAFKLFVQQFPCNKAEFSGRKEITYFI